jgi:hypothetical protein
VRLRLEDLPDDMRQQAAAQLTAPKATAPDRVEDAAKSEKGLQVAAEHLLRRLGWKFFHMPGAAAIGNPRGWPDLIAFGPDGRLLLIELKAAKGKLSAMQTWTFDALKTLGHTVHVCRSLTQVEKLITGEQP